MNDEDEKPSQFYKYLAVYMSIQAAETARQKREAQETLALYEEERNRSRYQSEASLQAYRESLAELSAKPTPTPPPPAPSDKPSAWLWFGIIVAPLVFGWFLLKKEHRPKLRYIIIGYIILILVLSFHPR